VRPICQMRVLLALSLLAPGRVASVAGRLPEETIRNAAEFFAKRGLREIQQAVADEASKHVQQLQEQLPLAQEELQAVVDSSLSQARNARAAVERGQAANIEHMRKGIDTGLANVLPEAVQTARDFAKSRALIDTAQALQPDLHTIVAEEGVAEDERRDAAVTIQAALATSSELQELAHEAHDLATYLHEAHAEGHAQAANERNHLAEAQAQQSLRIVRKAGTIIHDAGDLARLAYRRALKAEQQAEQAVQTARRNTESLQRLKVRAQQALEQVKRTTLTQRSSHKSPEQLALK